jgi:hypothetical protein
MWRYAARWRRWRSCRRRAAGATLVDGIVSMDFIVYV